LAPLADLRRALALRPAQAGQGRT